eukprot:1482453-Pyramimonas_sp.AAC.1
MQLVGQAAPRRALELAPLLTLATARRTLAGRTTPQRPKCWTGIPTVLSDAKLWTSHKATTAGATTHSSFVRYRRRAAGSWTNK